MKGKARSIEARKHIGAPLVQLDVDILTISKYFIAANEQDGCGLCIEMITTGTPSFSTQVESCEKKGMHRSKDTEPDNTEPQTKENTKGGSFFKKYALLMPLEHGTANEQLFKKYVPPRIDSNENNTVRPSAEDPQLLDVEDPGEATSRSEWRRTRTRVWWGVASATLVLAFWMILRVVLQTPDLRTQQTEGLNPTSAAETASDVGARTSALIESPPLRLFDSVLAGSLDGKSKNPSKPDRSRNVSISSPDVLHNVMLARAREYEDRGMLMQAEEEYRAVTSSFPNDTFSQFGLRRVQAVLSAKRQNEMSRLSRELGLKKFRTYDFAGAERDLAAAVNAGRTDTATLYALGMSYVRLGHYAKAAETLDQCIAANPDYAPALVGLAEASAASGRKDQALPLLQRALQLGGGAEFTPAKIEEMISELAPEQATSSPPVLPSPPPGRSQPTFLARAVHGHDFLLTSCRGDLEIVNSVVHFNASNPSHSFHVLASRVTGARISGKELQFNVNAKVYRFTLNGRSARDFLDALVR